MNVLEAAPLNGPENLRPGPKSSTVVCSAPLTCPVHTTMANSSRFPLAPRGVDQGKVGEEGEAGEAGTCDAGCSVQSPSSQIHHTN